MNFLSVFLYRTFWANCVHLTIDLHRARILKFPNMRFHCSLQDAYIQGRVKAVRLFWDNIFGQKKGIFWGDMKEEYCQTFCNAHVSSGRKCYFHMWLMSIFIVFWDFLDTIHISILVQIRGAFFNQISWLPPVTMLCSESLCAWTSLFPDVTELGDKDRWTPDSLQLQKGTRSTGLGYSLSKVNVVV